MTQTREQWLNAAVDELRPLFKNMASVTLPKDIRVSTGWSKRPKKNSIGWTWPTGSTSDKVNNVFISPEVEDSLRVLEVLAHELCHVADDCKNAHKGNFVTIFRAIGMEGKVTQCNAGETLKLEMGFILSSLGPYPHVALYAMPTDSAPKQTTRMIKVVCVNNPECEYTVRMTRKWLDEMGAPGCPCGHSMNEAVTA